MSKRIVSGIRESKNLRGLYRKSQMQQCRPNICDRAKTGTSKDEMDINTLNSCPAALREPKKGLVTDKTEPYRVAFPLDFIKSSSILAPM